MLQNIIVVWLWANILSCLNDTSIAKYCIIKLSTKCATTQIKCCVHESVRVLQYNWLSTNVDDMSDKEDYWNIPFKSFQDPLMFYFQIIGYDNIHNFFEVYTSLAVR